MRHTNLHDDGSCLFFRNRLVLLQVKVEIMAVTVLQDSAKRVGINLKYVVQLHDSWMIQRLVDIVFSKSMSTDKNQTVI